MASSSGKYEVVKQLADGGTAQVLIARTRGLEGFVRHVVIKRIKAEKADAKSIQKFLDEARLTATLHHANIVQVHDIGEDNGEYFFAMEYVHGEDLHKMLRQTYLRGEKFPLEHAVKIAISVCCGLHHAHEYCDSHNRHLGLIHRDISPSNILVGYDGAVKLTDFGVAKATLATRDTKTGAFQGNVAYMSPEQCLGEMLDRRSDIFSIGVVLHELVTTKRLFKGSTAFVIMEKIVTNEIPRPRSIRADIPRALDEVIMRALSRNPAERYETAEDMQLALEEIAVELRSKQTLSAYLELLFGQRPEPWLVENEPAKDPHVPLDFIHEANAKTTIDPDAARKAIALAREDGSWEPIDSADIIAIRASTPVPRPASTPSPRPATPASTPASASPPDLDASAAEALLALDLDPPSASTTSSEVTATSALPSKSKSMPATQPEPKSKSKSMPVSESTSESAEESPTELPAESAAKSDKSASAPARPSVMPMYRGGRSIWPYIGGVLLLLLIAAAVIVFVVYDDSTEATAKPQPSPVAAPVEPAPVVEPPIEKPKAVKRPKKKSSYDPKALFPPKK